MRFSAIISLGIASTVAGCGSSGHSGPDRVPPSYTVTEPVVFVAVGGTGTLRVLKQSDLSTIANVSLRGEERPHHLALSGDRTRLSVSLLPATPVDGGTAAPSAKGELLVLNVRTGEELGSAVVTGAAENATFLRDGRLAFADRVSNVVRFAQLNATTKNLDAQADVPVCTTPLEVTPTLDQARLLIACEGSNTIGIVDVTSRTRVDVAVGTRPSGVWVGNGSDNRYYVTNAGTKDLSIGAIGQTPMSFALGFVPGQAVTNPTGTEVAVTDRDGGRVVIFRTMDMLMLAQLPTGAGAEQVAWSSDGKKLYVTNQTAGSLTSILHPDATTLTLDKTLDVGAGPVGLLLFTP